MCVHACGEDGVLLRWCWVGGWMDGCMFAGMVDLINLSSMSFCTACGHCCGVRMGLGLLFSCWMLSEMGNFFGSYVFVSSYCQGATWDFWLVMCSFLGNPICCVAALEQTKVILSCTERCRNASGN